jgi:hypothetical protein
MRRGSTIALAGLIVAAAVSGAGCGSDPIHAPGDAHPAAGGHGAGGVVGAGGSGAGGRGSGGTDSAPDGGTGTGGRGTGGAGTAGTGGAGTGGQIARDAAADRAGCSLACRPMTGGSWCTAPTIEWVCSGAQDLGAYRAACDELPTNAIRFCCPPDFMSQCF